MDFGIKGFRRSALELKVQEFIRGLRLRGLGLRGLGLRVSLNPKP